MRVFAAIFLPEEVRTAIYTVALQLREKGDPASWVRPENMHLTLCFYGEVPEEKVKRLADWLSEHLPCHERPLLLARGVSAFPSITRPSVLWAGLDTLSGNLDLLQQDTELAALEIGLPAETKPFHPHITLARLRRPGKGTACAGLLASFQENGHVPEFGREFHAESVVLFSSALTPRGPVYKVLREMRLK